MFKEEIDATVARLTFQKPTTMVIVGDWHCPYHFQPALDLSLSIAKSIQPQIIILLGDIIDFYSVSPFDKNPTRAANLQEDINTTKRNLSNWRKQLPKAKFIYIEGNHERFLQKYIWRSAPAMASLSSLQVNELLNLDFPYLTKVDVYAELEGIAYPNVQLFFDGEYTPFLTIAHGDGFNLSSSAINIAKLLLDRTKTNIIAGHWHIYAIWKEISLHGEIRESYIVPCLARPQPHWTARPFQLGMAVLSIYPDKHAFAVENILFAHNRRENVLLAHLWRRIYSHPCRAIAQNGLQNP